MLKLLVVRTGDRFYHPLHVLPLRLHQTAQVRPGLKDQLVIAKAKTGRKPLNKFEESTPHVLKGTRGIMAGLLVTVLLGAYCASEPRVQRNQAPILPAKINAVNNFDRPD